MKDAEANAEANSKNKKSKDLRNEVINYLCRRQSQETEGKGFNIRTDASSIIP